MQSGVGNVGDVQEGEALASGNALEGLCSFGTLLGSTVNPESEMSLPWLGLSRGSSWDAQDGSHPQAGSGFSFFLPN